MIMHPKRTDCGEDMKEDFQGRPLSHLKKEKEIARFSAVVFPFSNLSVTWQPKGGEENNNHLPTSRKRVR